MRRQPDVERMEELHRRAFRDHALNVLDFALVIALFILAMAVLR